MPHFTSLPPLSLYIHVPWCVKKCPYCDFNSHQIKTSIPESLYIDALIKDLECELPKVWGRKVISIFIGGGTPSTLSPESYETLLTNIRARIPLASNIEITMEANPGTLDNEKLAGFREVGINRLSLGVQSFNNTHLKALGRIHDADQARAAVEKARTAGFDNINIDLMFALPGQTLEQAADDVTRAIALKPQHISYYHLTIEPNTWFYQHPPVVPDNDLAYDMLEQGQSLLSHSHYEQYEVSAYALARHQCKHNVNYWHFGDYLGIGAGAHQKISRADTQNIVRSAKHRHPQTYLDAADNLQFANTETELKESEILFEFLMNGLRLKSGFPVELFCKHTGLQAEILKNPLAPFVNQGLIEMDELHICTSKLGFEHLDSLLVKLSEKLEN